MCIWANRLEQAVEVFERARPVAESYGSADRRAEVTSARPWRAVFEHKFSAYLARSARFRIDAKILASARAAVRMAPLVAGEYNFAYGLGDLGVYLLWHGTSTKPKRSWRRLSPWPNARMTATAKGGAKVIWCLISAVPRSPGPPGFLFGSGPARHIRRWAGDGNHSPTHWCRTGFVRLSGVVPGPLNAVIEQGALENRTPMTTGHSRGLVALTRPKAATSAFVADVVGVKLSPGWAQAVAACSTQADTLLFSGSATVARNSYPDDRW
jgi:hypothetical protein